MRAEKWQSKAKQSKAKQKIMVLLLVVKRKLLNSKLGFTLIEISIVLVIIGFLAGGFLVGKDLISAAEIRSQISQIEKYNVAVNTFKGKYGYLPGDIPETTASAFGFKARGIYAGQGDGNGVVQGLAWGDVVRQCTTAGEAIVFWMDLSAANLIEGNFTSGSINTRPTTVITGTSIDAYLPRGKIGNNNFVYVWSGGLRRYSPYDGGNDGHNYFGVVSIEQFGGVNGTAGGALAGYIQSSANISVNQAYSMDAKIDDGLPQSGNVQATYIYADGPTVWAKGGGSNAIGRDPSTGEIPSSLTCYDSNSNASNPMKYSTNYNNGTGQNCALSFKF